MKVAGFAGFSGSGKTTLIERLIPLLRQQGLSVSVVKHAHHRFDLDHPGKDSWRHRQAGAQEVLLVCDRRLALVREFGETRDLDVHAMLAELDPRVDWVLVEGFKQGDLPKIELWRQPEPGSKPRALRFPQDPQVLALATDDPAALPQQPPAGVALLDLNQPTAIVDWMLAHAGRLEYRAAAQGSTACSPRL